MILQLVKNQEGTLTWIGIRERQIANVCFLLKETKLCINKDIYKRLMKTKIDRNLLLNLFLQAISIRKKNLLLSSNYWVYKANDFKLCVFFNTHFNIFLNSWQKHNNKCNDIDYWVWHIYTYIYLNIDYTTRLYMLYSIICIHYLHIC